MTSGQASPVFGGPGIQCLGYPLRTPFGASRAHPEPMQGIKSGTVHIRIRGRKPVAPIGYALRPQSPSLRTGGAQPRARRKANRDESETSLIRHAADNAGNETVRREGTSTSIGTGA